MEIVRPVAVGTYRRIQFAPGVGESVHTFVVRDDYGALPQVEFLHLGNVPMAPATGLGNVRPVHRRRRVSVIEQFVRVAMAILARCGFGDALVDRLAVIALEVDVRLDAVALAATNRLVRLRVRQLRDVGVTTGAEILRVDRHLEFLFIHKQRHRPAHGVRLDERLVRVAGETISVIDGLRHWPGP